VDGDVGEGVATPVVGTDGLLHLDGGGEPLGGGGEGRHQPVALALENSATAGFHPGGEEGVVDPPQLIRPAGNPKRRADSRIASGFSDW
jgi:hypothetical protein